GGAGCLLLFLTSDFWLLAPVFADRAFCRAHLGHTRMMLATGCASTRSTSQPARMARSAGGTFTSQYQQRPLPYAQMARNASGMSIGSRFATLSLFNLTSGPLQELFGHG